MAKRKYLILFLVLVICALGSDLVSKGCCAKSTYFLARSATVAESEKAQAKMKHEELLRKGLIFGYLGLGLAVLSFIFWVGAEGYREAPWRVLLPLLLGFYLLLQFVMV
ncbi:MAG TPA: hypothetical protein VMW16_01040 [Sedimentisphaerales bacterium]|nr:hypothetical protein [Sedimentisphaerales bacterium]